MHDIADATASYRRAKKSQTVRAVNVGGIRSEISNLESRMEDRRRQGGDTSPLAESLVRAQERLRTEEQALAAAGDAYRHSHLELLMQPGPFTHYKQEAATKARFADMTGDDDERAAVTELNTTIALVERLVQERSTAIRWWGEQSIPTNALATANLVAAAAFEEFGVYQDPAGERHSITLASDGTLTCPALPSPARLPFDYQAGVPFHGGHLAVNPAIELQQHVTPGTITGYLEAFTAPAA